MPSAENAIKRETVVLIAFVAFVLGVLVGITYMVFREVYLAHEGHEIRSSSFEQDRSDALGSDRENMEAILRAKTKVQDDPGDVEAWIQLGNMYFDLGQTSEAIAAYEKALALKPGNPDVLTDLGVMYRRQGDPQKAVELFQEAQKVDSRHLHSLYNLGVVLLHDLNDVSGAAEAWEAYLEAHPQGPHADRIRNFLLKWKAEGKISEPVS